MAEKNRPVLNNDGSSSGGRVNAAKYDQIHTAIVDAIPDGSDGLAYKDLVTAIREALPDFEGSVSWYVTTVKLDMEGRGEIERIAGVSPQRLRKAGR